MSGTAQTGLGLVRNKSSDPLVDGASVKQLGRRGLSVVLRGFPVKLGRKDVRVKLLVVVFKLVSVNKDLRGGRESETLLRNIEKKQEDIDFKGHFLPVTNQCPYSPV